MNIHFLGGANEVGASSTLIEIDGYRILVDAGIRMGSGQNSPLPDFSVLDKIGMPDAVLLTHAHTDHTGALPVLRNLWLAGVKLYHTPATKSITRVLLEDSVNRMEREEQEEGKLPLYTRDDVEVALHCMEKEVQWLEPEEIGEGVKATWIPAGHILGAAMIYIEGKSESVLMTGDVSVTAQLTVPSMVVPSWCKPDVMVMESTYGNRPHKRGRTREANRLVRDIAKAFAAGRKVLIPVFSIGRAQEVILILKHALARKKIRRIPVYIDGMVRDVNKIYSGCIDELPKLPKPLRRKVENGEDLFYSETIRKVTSSDERDSILAGEPCCIVASSGMLNGGISNYYASRLVSDQNNLIAITGYQAEGTPGRALVDLAEKKDSTDRMWSIDNKCYIVECQVKRYSLSAHADMDQLVKLVKKVSPRTVFLVHGDEKARKGLDKSIQKELPDVNVILPENREVYRAEKRIGIAEGRRLSNDRALTEVAAFVRKMEWKGPFRVRELAEIWFGTEAVTPIVVKVFQWDLSLGSQFFECRSGDLFYLR